MKYLNEIILSNLFLMLVFGFYQGFLRNNRNFKATRFFLLTGSILSTILPWLPWQVPLPVKPIFLSTQPVDAVLANGSITLPEAAARDNFSSVQIMHWLLWAYLAIAGFLLLTFLAQGIRMARWSRKGPRHQWNGLRVVEFQRPWPAFSFLQTIFYPEPYDPTKPETQTILEHERVHIRQLHSIDSLLLLVVRILFFYNPVVHLLADRLRLVHEYLADEATAGADRTAYSQTLIRHQFLVPRLLLMHSFNNQSFLKHRLNMLLKTNTRRAMWPYLFAAPLAAGMILLSGWSASARNPKIVYQAESPVIFQDQVKPPQEKKKQVFVVVEDMPTFQNGDIKDFRKWVQKNVKYPEIAKKNGISGNVYLEFVVDTMGKVVDPKITRGVDPALDNEALRVVSSSPLWIPGKQRGKNVNVSFSLPVSFVLSKDGKMVKPPKESKEPVKKVMLDKGGQEKQVFLVVEDMPTFQGGTIDKFRYWIQTNVKYPEIAKKNGIQGTEYVTFIIDTTGQVTDASIIRSADPVLDAEVYRVLKASPRWKPGYQKGKAVNVYFSIPVKFVLDKEAATKKDSITKQVIK